MVFPFLVGFDFPDSAGTYVNASAGAGHYRFTPTCSRYTYGSGLQEGAVGVQHRIAMPPSRTQLTRSRLIPDYITFSGSGDWIHRRITLLSIDDKPEYEGGPPFVPDPGDRAVGFHWDRNGWAGRAKIGFDWRWVGAEFGAAWMDYDHGPEMNDYSALRGTIGMPVLGLRLGDADNIYFMAEFMESNPMVTGGGYGGYGIGIKAGSTRMTYGVSSGPYGGAFRIKLVQTEGPFLFSVSGLADPRRMKPEGVYGFSFGLGYKVFGNR